jgi:hypothetical protein
MIRVCLSRLAGAAHLAGLTARSTAYNVRGIMTGTARLRLLLTGPVS